MFLLVLLLIGGGIAFYRLHDFLRDAPAREIYQAGVRDVEQQRRQDALQEWEKGITLYPDFAPSYQMLADAYLSAGQYQQAKEVLTKLHRRLPDEPHTLCKLAEAEFALGETQEAAQDAQSETERDPNCVKARYVLGQALVAQGQGRQAIDQLRRALALQPDNLDAALLLAQVYIGSSNFDKAQSVLEPLLPAHRQDAQLAYLLGYAYLRNAALPDHFQKAETALKQALALSPRHDGAQHELGRLYLETGRLADARTHLEEAARLAPDYSPTFYDLARLYRLLHLPDKERAAQARFTQLKRQEMQHMAQARRKEAERLSQTVAAADTVNPAPAGLAAPASPASDASDALFTDVAERAGIRFTHSNGGWGRHYFAEISGSGCAFIDYDNDGYLDVLLLQAGPLPFGEPHGAGTTAGTNGNRLYHNNKDGTFTDVTQSSGLEKTGYAQGVAVGDVDGDGYDDLYITAYGGNFLFHNEHGMGKFKDVTKQAGVADNTHGPRYSLSAAFGDYNHDGHLDLFVTHYVKWTPQTDVECLGSDKRSGYCRPDIYAPDTPTLFRNNGDGTFTDVTKQAGLAHVTGRAMGCIWLDFNKDGWEDIFVSCDMSPNLLLRNNKDGTFTNVALEAGVAYGEMGQALSGMGIGVGDYDNDGAEDLFVTNFSGQGNSLRHNDGGGAFSDRSAASGITRISLPYLGFGCEFLDVDNDGWKDIIVANGHVMEDVGTMSADTTFAERKSLYRNNGNGTFADVMDRLGALSVPRVSRGLAVGDFDNDGSPDVLVNNMNAPAQLLRNNTRNGNHWITLKLLDTHGSTALHAKVTLTASGKKQYAEVRSGSSYCAASDTRVHFGLGAATKIDGLDILWYDGRRTHLPGLAADRVSVIRENGHSPGS